ncbi:MAG: ribosome maturation factor RimM [Actinobacteria bacterium]|nr:ribosome maturation factor RimM [Actinomycetota bacterium]
MSSSDAGEAPEATVSIGRVGRPHGLDGSFVVERASEDETRFEVGAQVLVDGRAARVVARKRSGGRLVIRLDRAVGRGAALELRRSDLPPPEPGFFYAFELVGLPVLERGERLLGRVVGVEPGPANDVLELDSGELLPLVEACVSEVDLAGGRIVVEPGFGARDAQEG